MSKNIHLEKDKRKPVPEECPLDSEIGRNWHIRTRTLLTNPDSSDSAKAELCRRLAADSHLRSLAFKSHGDTAKEHAARHEMEAFMRQASELCDNPDGINNYADPSVHLASTFRNRSKFFKTKLSMDHPIVTKFLSQTPTMADKKVEEEEIQNFAEFLRNSTGKKKQATENDLNLPNQSRSMNPDKPTFASAATAVSFVEQPRQNPRFDLQNGVNGKFGNFSSNQQAPARPAFQGSNGVARSLNPNFGNNQTSIATPKFGLPGMGPRPPMPRFPARPQQGSVVNKNHEFGSNVDNVDRTKSASAKSVPAFRTAHDELIIQANQKRGNDVSSSSYGTAKKTLGVPRSGNVAGSFKPPIASKSPDGKSAQVENGSGPTITNEKLKHLDPKMVELIQSEIMDQGSNVEWSDIAGLEFVKTTVKEIVVFPLLRPDIFTGLRGPPKGLLLFGPPGTGKTLIGKCIACQSRSTFFSISASSLTSKWVGEGEKMVRTLFEVARAFQPSVVFIDEIDSLLSQRSDNEHESSRRIKTEFLVQLDGATSTGEERILVVGATNRPQDLDEAARRRLVKRLYVPLPEQNAREHIVRNLLSTQAHSLTEDNVVAIGAKAEGYSGADMSNLCKEAAMGPIRSLDYSKIDEIMADDVRPISMVDFMDAFKQVKASVSDKDLQLYMEWDAQFGSGK